MEFMSTVIFIAKRAAMLAGLGSLIATISGSWQFAIGLSAGALASVLNLALLGMSISRAIQMPPPAIARFMGWRYFPRYFAMGVVLYLALKMGMPYLLGTLTGLYLVKFIILMMGVFGYRGGW